MPTPRPYGRRLNRSDYATDSETLARSLLGCVLVRVLDDGTRLSGRIVEVEAYIGVDDKASHAYKGRRSARNESMYGRPGLAYVYVSHGVYPCMNVVCAEEGVPIAVLLRALEPVEGVDEMYRRRRPPKSGRRLHLTELCSGPGRLCQALGIDRGLDGEDLVTSDRLYVAAARRAPAGESPLGVNPLGRAADKDVARVPRIGVGYAQEWAEAPLRWILSGNPHVSVPPPSSPAGL